MEDKNFLLLENNYMSFYTLQDIEGLNNVVIYHSKKVSKSKFISLLYNIHNSAKIRRYIELPFKGIWDRVLFRDILQSFVPDYIIFTTCWYSDHLINFFRNNSPNSKLILRFSDMVSRELGDLNETEIVKIKKQFDGVIAYNQEDCDNYGFTYHSVGYSRLKKECFVQTPKYDVVFIGADKGRLEHIRDAYYKFTSAGLKCFFYLIQVKKEDRRNDGIIYSDRIMPFCEYLSYELSSKCLFEIVQDGSTGRTYRMMEAIIYNKLLITNCPEIMNTDYYNIEYIQLYNKVSDIDPSFVFKNHADVNYEYKGEFSPLRYLEFITLNW